MDRRDFMIGSGLLAGSAWAAQPSAATAAAGSAGRSLAEFGVTPGGDGDQSAAFQRAIDEISAAGHAVVIPGGSYLVTGLKLPARCAIFGTSGLTTLAATPGAAIFEAPANEAASIIGLTLDGGAEGSVRSKAAALVSIKGGRVQISHCRAQRCGGSAFEITDASGTIEALEVDTAFGAALLIAGSRGLTVSGCRFNAVQGEAVKAEGAVLLTANHVRRCTTGIALAGNGMVNGNVVTGSSTMGLRLGGAGEAGQIVATGNNIQDCAVGIGVSAGGETIFASLNLITGAKNGAVRAFDGQKLLGPDLARESAEAYLNLTVAGNVSR